MRDAYSVLLVWNHVVLAFGRLYIFIFRFVVMDKFYLHEVNLSYVVLEMWNFAYLAVVSLNVQWSSTFLQFYSTK